jgi:hypothetical protein
MTRARRFALLLMATVGGAACGADGQPSVTSDGGAADAFGAGVAGAGGIADDRSLTTTGQNSSQNRLHYLK